METVVRCREPGCGREVARGEVGELSEEREAWQWTVERCMRIHYPKHHLRRWIELEAWLGAVGEQARMEAEALREPFYRKLRSDLSESLGAGRGLGA